MILQDSHITTTQPKDDFLISQIVSSKDYTCIEALYNRYSRKVYCKCLSMVKYSSLAEDLMHDIFIKTVLNLSKFKGKSKFSTWLFSITYNHCMDCIRKHRRINIVELSEEECEIEDYKSNSIDFQIKQMMELLEMLKSHEKLILQMKYQYGLSIKEIQKILNVSESAIKMRLSRAKEKVRVLYKSTYKECL